MRTRKREFLAQMDTVVSWASQAKLVAPYALAIKCIYLNKLWEQIQ